MKYRGKGFHERFVADDMEGYVEDDKEQFLKYMRKNDFHTFVDVWIHNIKIILELKMDLQGKWKQDLIKRIYLMMECGLSCTQKGCILLSAHLQIQRWSLS